jgi:hypothetical protein
VRALLKAEALPHKIWEPAAGRLAIVNVLRAAGHEVIASDIVNHGIALNFRADFLQLRRAPVGTQAILTNSPFFLGQQFAEHALELSPLVVMLFRLSFLESARRTRLLEHSGLARVHVFRDRLPMMHRDGWTGRRAGSAMSFGWFVWVRGYRGAPTLHRITSRDAA